MNTAVTLLMVLFFFTSCILLLANLISRIRHKNTRKMNILTILSLLLFLATFLMLLDDLSMVFMMLGLLFGLAMVICILLMLIRKITHKSNRMLTPVTLILLMLTVVSFAGSSRISEMKRQKAREEHELNEESEKPIQTSLNFEVTDGDAPIEIQTFQEGFHATWVYDNDYIDKIPPLEDASYADCHRELDANPDISSQFKTFLHDYLDRLEKHYPTLPLHILYHNLKTLKVEELDSSEYMFKSWSTDSLGCYRTDENCIYIPKGTIYEEGDFGFQVLLHEFGHMAREARFKEDKEDYRTTFINPGSDCLTNEAMNSVFSCSLLNYYEKDIAYQIPSNYMRIMLECMDNYELEDYYLHSESWFYKRLDETTGHTNYAQTIWKLICLQRNDWKDEKIDIPAESYYPIYDYLCDLYFGKYITKEMTEEERKAVADELVEKAFFDAPENYPYTEERIYENLSHWD